MIVVHPGALRRHEPDGHDAWFGFDVLDPPDEDGAFGSSRVELIEYLLPPGIGLPIRTLQDTERILYLCAGVLDHDDDLGHSGTLRAGDFHHLRSGRGLRPSHVNASPSDTARVFEIRLHSDARDREPASGQRRFSVAERKGRYCLVGAEHGPEPAFSLLRDVRVFSSLPDVGHHLVHPLALGRQAWLHVAAGRIRVDACELVAGDEVVCREANALAITALTASDLLLVDIPRLLRGRRAVP